MKVYTLHQVQLIPADLETVWAYFATLRNLNDLTPPEMDFYILWGADEPMYAGQLIAYRLRILPGVRVFWPTQITHVEPMRRFIDEQRMGPYCLWIHEHRFEPVEGGVRMTDHVTYALPFGPLGMLAHRLFVRRRLEFIFAYRRQVIAQRFATS